MMPSGRTRGCLPDASECMTTRQYRHATRHEEKKRKKNTLELTHVRAKAGNWQTRGWLRFLLLPFTSVTSDICGSYPDAQLA